MKQFQGIIKKTYQTSTHDRPNDRPKMVGHNRQNFVFDISDYVCYNQTILFFLNFFANPYGKKKIDEQEIKIKQTNNDNKIIKIMMMMMMLMTIVI